MDKENIAYIHNEIYKNEITSFTGIWVGLEVIMLSEISQIQKDKCHIFSHMWNLVTPTHTHTCVCVCVCVCVYPCKCGIV
jgi:hypothetical protein